MTKRTIVARLKSAPGIVVSLLVAATMLTAFGGKVFAVFRTPARVDAVEIEVRGHHDTLQVVYLRTLTVDSIHIESHAIQGQLRDIGFILCDLSDIPARDCTVARQP